MIVVRDDSSQNPPKNGCTMSDPTRQEEFVHLLADCQSRVRATVYALIQNMHDVEEVYQQACLVMWRKFDTYQPGTQFVKWACSIAYLEVKKFLSQNHRSTRFSREFLAGFVAWETALPVETGNLSTQALYACMERLNASDRRVLQLRYWENRPVVDIAAELGRSPQSVSNTLGRIRAQLLECVKQVRAAEDRS
jgi:RNA polymerase sigma-70 factor, ECF subfamily